MSCSEWWTCHITPCINLNTAVKDKEVLFIEIRTTTVCQCITQINSHKPKRAHTTYRVIPILRGGLNWDAIGEHVTAFTVHFTDLYVASVTDWSSLMIQCSHQWWRSRLFGNSLPWGPLYPPPTNTFLLKILLISHLANSTEYYPFIIFNVQPSHICSVYSFSPVCWYFPVCLFV